MLYNLLYICAETQLSEVKTALERMQAKPIKTAPPLAGGFEISHRLLGDLRLEISLLTDLDGISPHLRRFPVDLMIYDERGEGALTAPNAISRIRADVRSLADLWGPDFLFPMSRVVTVLNPEARHAERAFELGRLHVRDVCVSPKSITTLILWLKRVLTKGIIRKNRVGLALSGGGLEGFLYQLGVLHALDQAISNEHLSRCHVIAGVSSGAIAGSTYAAKIPPSEVIKALHNRSSELPPLSSQTIYDIAGAKIARRILKESVSSISLNPQEWINTTMRSIPTGFLKGDNLEDYFRQVMLRTGQRDRFEDLDAQLLIGATDQDSFEHVVFGEPPWDKIHVSEAVRASIALPPVFMPKELNGRWFIDGQVTKTIDLEMVIEKGCSLVIIINPLKPFTTSVPGSTDKEGGVHSTIQTIKALVSSRFEASLKHITERFPDVDFMVFEPDEECAAEMAGSPMRYKIRTQVIQLAYRSTLRKLRERHPVYRTKLGKYNYRLRTTRELQDLEQLDISKMGSDP